MANQYDNYVGFDYIPVPFEQYAKAGEMQQGKYDQAQNQLQDLQDKLAALPSRQIDVVGKNKIMDEYNQKALSILDNNKTYNPNLQQQIRNLARETARDKRIQGITYAYGREKEIKDLEKQMIARGESPYKYHDDWSKKAYVDASGNEVWDNMYDTDHGVETKYDYYKAAENFTKDFAPKLQSLGMSIQDNDIIHTDKKTGQQTKLPMSFLKTGSVESLNANQKWVKDEVNKLIQPFMSTKEGKQFSHYQGSRYDMNDNSIQERYAGFKKQGLSDNEIKDIFRKDAANQLLLSTIKPVYREQVKYDDITAALNSAKGRDRQNEGMPFFNAMSGIGYNTNEGAADAVVNVNTPIEAIELSNSEIQRATKDAENKFNKYIQDNKGKIQRDLDAGKSVNPVLKGMYDFFNRNSKEESENLKQQFIQKELNNIKESKKSKLLENKEAAYTPSQWSTDTKTSSYFKNKFNMITPNDAKLANATGKSIGGTLEQVLADTDLTMEDLQENAEFVRVRTSKSPEGYATNSAEYSVYLPEDVAEKVRKINKDVLIVIIINQNLDKSLDAKIYSIFLNKCLFT